MDIKTIIAFFMGILIIMITFMLIMNINNDCCGCGNTDNHCCPCPNKEYFDIVNEWSDVKASSAGSWKTICDEYKKEFNETFDCFE